MFVPPTRILTIKKYLTGYSRSSYDLNRQSNYSRLDANVQPEIMETRRDPAGIAAVVSAATIWGGSFVLAKILLETLPMAHVVLYRYVLATGFVLPILLAKTARPAREDLPLFALTGFLMVPVTILLQFGGLELTSATSAALMIGTETPLLALAAVAIERERMGLRGWAGVGVSSVGVLLLVGLPSEGSHALGNFLVFASMLVSVIWVLMSKRLVGRYPAFVTTGWILVFGTLFLIPVSVAWEGLPSTSLSWPDWGSLLGLSLGCTVLAYSCWNWGVNRIGAGPSGVYLNAQPAVGAVLGIALLGDPMTAGVVGGGALIVTAAGMISAGDADDDPLPAPSTTPRGSLPEWPTAPPGKPCPSQAALASGFEPRS